jgi:hypothetical protein
MGNCKLCYRQVGLLLLVSLFIISISPARAQEPLPADTQPAFDPRFGIVDSFLNTNEANAAGAGWTRIIFRWDVVQPGGPSDWKPTNVPDTFIDAEVAAGREVAAVLIGTPGWATDNGISTAVPPIEFWGDFVFKIATQYKGRINHWIIWNQPDITDPASPSHTWDGDEEAYYRLLKESYLKIKAADPAAQVHLAGLTYTWDQERGQPQYLARLLDIITTDPQAATENYFFDVVSYHLYYNPAQILEILTDIRNILDSYGLGQKPIWINETNAPPTEDFLEPPAESVQPKITLEEQSAFVIQAFALSLAGGAERIAFNNLRNEKNPPSIVPYGLLRGDNSRRPAFDAFRTVSTHLAGVRQATWQKLDNIYIVTLDRGEQTTTVLWNMAPAPVNYTLSAIAAQASLIDERGHNVPITANNGGYRLELPAAACSNGAYCFIGGAPRLVVEAGSPAQRAPLQPAIAAAPATPTLALAPASVEDAPSLEGVSSIEGASPVEALLTPLPLETPTTAAQQTPTLTTAIGISATVEESATPPVETLPAPGVGETLPGVELLPDPDTDPSADAEDGAPSSDGAPSGDSEVDATPTIIPPVTVATVLRPSRLLWLFIIGLVIFTITYGVQVVIWYRLKR